MSCPAVSARGSCRYVTSRSPTTWLPSSVIGPANRSSGECGTARPCGSSTTAFPLASQIRRPALASAHASCERAARTIWRAETSTPRGIGSPAITRADTPEAGLRRRHRLGSRPLASDARSAGEVRAAAAPAPDSALGVDAQAEVAQGLCELLVRRGSLRRCDGFGFTAGMAASRYVETNALANEYVLNPELQRDALDGLEALARL